MDKESALIIVNLFGYLVLGAQILIIGLVLLLVLKRINPKNKSIKPVVDFLSTNSLTLAFFVVLGATVGSLFFSEIARFIPCKLCWEQRIFMYPQVVILGIAALKNDFAVKRYVLALSLIGSAIAIYHYVLQMSPIPLPCSDEIANCALKQVSYFGYITIPLMSLTAFLLIILLMIFTKQKK